jgi:hypothetical protein
MTAPRVTPRRPGPGHKRPDVVENGSPMCYHRGRDPPVQRHHGWRPLDSLAYRDQQGRYEGPRHDDYGRGAGYFAAQFFSFSLIEGPAGRCHQNGQRFVAATRDGAHLVCGHLFKVGHMGAKAQLDHVL